MTEIESFKPIEPPHENLPADQAKPIEDQPIWELTKYKNIDALHEVAIDLAEQIADETDEGRKDELRQEYKEHLIRLNEFLLTALGDLRENLDFQEEHNLVKHKWGLGLEPFSEALAEGTRIIEMDIRATSDGEPVIAHSMKVGGKKVHETPFDEVMKTRDATSLRQIFEQFVPYSREHELVLELKDIASVERAIELVHEYHLEDCIRFASLSPAILEAVYQKFPEVRGLILNGGVVPFITVPMDKKGETGKLEAFVMNGNPDWHTADLGPVQVVFGANSFPTPEEAVARGEGVGKFLGYAFFRIPYRLQELLKGDKNAISLSAVLIAANLISIISPQTGQEMMRSYQAMADRMGLKTMATTWMESLGGRIRALSAEQQFKLLKELGVDIIYTADPVNLAEAIRAEK